MSPRYDVEEFSTLQDDLSGGLVSRVSSVGLKKKVPPRFVKEVRNFLFRPARAISVRPGYRDSSAAALAELPTSLRKHYHASGNKLFVATDDGAGSGHVYRHTAASDTLQTLPITPSSLKWRFEMANGLLVGCQRGGAAAPIFYSITNPAETWHSLVLPKPAAAPTFNADVAGGSLTDTKTYYWRVRWRHTNGNSLPSPVTAGNTMNAPNLTASINVPLPASPRSDYLGWTLERTKGNGDANGPFFFVADGTAALASDGASDGGLFYESDNTIHGEPVPMDGVIFYRGRLVGWYGSQVFVSQPTDGEEATGIANWIGDLIYPFGKDDGDSIQALEIQGDRLIVGKRRSLWALEGTDPDNFRVVGPFYRGAGFAGPRAAATLGGVVMFAAGDGRFFVARGNSVEPIGATEIGDDLAAMDTTRDSEILAVNYLGDLVLFWYYAKTKTTPTDVLAYDLRFGTWTHFDGMPAVDAFVQDDVSDFNNATLLFADPRVLPPGNSGAVSLNPTFVVWHDKRGANWQFYIQKLDSNGVPQWTANGVQVGASVGTHVNANSWGVQVVSDGVGGCIVIFNDMRSGTMGAIYGQRFNSAGAPQWGAGGLLLQAIASYDADGTNSIAGVVSDRNGGVIYAYRDLGTGLFVQRLNSAGAKQWGAGTHIGDTTALWQGYGVQRFKMFANSDGSCFAGWHHYVGGNVELRAQLVNAAGVAQWASTTSGLLVQTGLKTSGGGIGVCSDARGGMLAMYTTSAGHQFVHRLDATGAKQWGASGVAVSLSTTVLTPTIAADATGGAFIAWVELFAGFYTVKVRRILPSGAAAWAPIPLGAAAASAATSAKWVSIVQDGYGGVVVGWDCGSGTGGAQARAIDALGVTSWGAEVQFAANAVAFMGSYSESPTVFVTDGASGVIAFYTDDATLPGDVTARNIYAHRLTKLGVGKWAAPSAVCALSAEQVVRAACFTDAPESEYPFGATAGRHVWCGFKGTRDMTDVNGAGGEQIPVRIRGHRYDDGLPDYVKDYDHFSLTVNRGSGVVVATIFADDGTATLTLEATVRAPKYNSGLTYNSGVKYATVGRVDVGTGLPKGTEGRGASVLLTANLEDMEIGGWVLDGYILPQKDSS